MKKLLMAFAIAAFMLAGCESVEHVSHDITFADETFKAHILMHFDTDQDGRISSDEASVVTQINVHTKGITSLKGIEAFFNLKILYCAL